MTRRILPTLAAVAMLVAGAHTLSACSDYTTVEPDTAPTTTAPPASETQAARGSVPDPSELGADAAQLRKLWEREHLLQDGRTVTCLSMEYTALSCDWEGATVRDDVQAPPVSAPIER